MKKLSLMLAFAMILTLLPIVGVEAVSDVVDLDVSDTEALYSGFNYHEQFIDNTEYDGPVENVTQITDEEFFGKWSSEEGEWTKEPYFNYEKYSEQLGDVEAAAKEGNYTLARELITDYYKEKFISQPRAISKAGTKDAMIKAKLAAYNTYAGTFNCLGFVNFTTTKSEVSTDILSIAHSAARDKVDKKRTFQVAAAYNDGSIAEIDSRETGNGAYAVVNVNGIDKSFPVVADTYIRGGDYADTNFGSEGVLKIAEADVFPETAEQKPPYSKPNTNPSDNYDGIDRSNTMRARFTIDFTGLTPGDEILEATLYMSGASDSTSPEGKICVVMYNANIDADERTVKGTWNEAYRSYINFTGREGGYGYRGDNSQQYFRMEMVNYDAALSLYPVYRETEDEIYAYHAFRYILAHIRGYGHTPEIASNNQGMLSLGTRGESLPIMLAHLATSKHFTADNFIPILKYVWCCGEALVEHWNSMSETSNWGLYQTRGLGALQVNFPEFKVVDAPLEEGGYGNGMRGGWYEVIQHRYNVIVSNIIRPDGAFTETLGYAKESVNGYLKYADNALDAGMPELAVFSDELLEKIDSLGLYIMTVTGPGFCDTQYGDSYAIDSNFASVFKDISSYSGNPVLQWAGSGGVYGTAPDYTSKVYEVSGKSALKTGWAKDDVYIDFSSDAGIRGHDHPDDLNIIMFAYGQYLLSDQRQFNYGTNAPERIAVYGTNAHNTLSLKTEEGTVPVYDNDGKEIGVTAKGEHFSHIQNVSGMYGGGYPVYSFVEKDPANWDNHYFNRSQPQKAGDLLRSEINSAYDYVEYTGENYKGYRDLKNSAKATGKAEYDEEDYITANVGMKRSLLFLKNAKYIIVTDFIDALDDKAYNVVQNWHTLPELKIDMDAATGIAKTNGSGANVQIIPVRADSQMNAYIDLDGAYCPSNGTLQQAPYVAYEKNGSGDKVYNTIILPTKAGHNVKTVTENLPLRVPETTASASRTIMNDTTINQTREVNYYILHDERNRIQQAFGNYATDAKLALVEKLDDNESIIILQNGTNVTDDVTKEALIKSNKLVEELAVRYDGSKIKIYSDKAIDFNHLTIKARGAVTAVYLNDEKMEFKLGGSYIYWGESPIISESNEIADRGDKESAPLHGRDGSLGSGGGLDNNEDKPDIPKTSISESFKEELQGHWGEAEIKELIDSGIVKGDDRGKLNLKHTVTRAELLTMLTRAIGVDEKSYNGEFEDVAAGDWYADVIAAAKEFGLVEGNGTMVMPNAPVTREQMAKFLVSALELIDKEWEEGSSIVFTDDSRISPWAKDYVDTATSLGILKGMADGSFNPKGEVLREQAFVAIGRLIK